MILVLERFIEMITERGLSFHQYENTRSDYRVDHLIDVSKDGRKLETYNTDFLHRFGEGDMARELDKHLATGQGNA